VLFASEEIELGKRKVLNEAHLKELVLPQQGEVLGRVLKISGGNQVIVQCIDGETRACRIRGKMKRRMWIRERDIVLVAPWDFDPKHADIMWRYIKDHADWLQNNGYLDKPAEAKTATQAAPAPVDQPTSTTATSQ
jgi:translation initiation factor 1A